MKIDALTVALAGLLASCGKRTGLDYSTRLAALLWGQVGVPARHQVSSLCLQLLLLVPSLALHCFSVTRPHELHSIS